MTNEHANHTTICRCCNQPMEVVPQERFSGGYYYLATCRNEQCALHNQTFDTADYATRDLSKYWKGN